MRNMRTTVNLDDDVVELAKDYAETHSLSIGKALSALVRRGIESPPKTKIVNGLVVFDVPESGEKITTERVKELESENW